jgi:hypothetical protein
MMKLFTLFLLVLSVLGSVGAYTSPVLQNYTEALKTCANRGGLFTPAFEDRVILEQVYPLPSDDVVLDENVIYSNKKPIWLTGALGPTWAYTYIYWSETQEERFDLQLANMEGWTICRNDLVDATELTASNVENSSNSYSYWFIIFKGCLSLTIVLCCMGYGMWFFRGFYKKVKLAEKTYIEQVNKKVEGGFNMFFLYSICGVPPSNTGDPQASK